MPSIEADDVSNRFGSIDMPTAILRLDSAPGSWVPAIGLDAPGGSAFGDAAWVAAAGTSRTASRRIGPSRPRTRRFTLKTPEHGFPRLPFGTRGAVWHRLPE